VDLTFAAHLAASSQSECQILNSTRIQYLLVVLQFQHSQACLLQWVANVRIRPPDAGFASILQSLPRLERYFKAQRNCENSDFAAFPAAYDQCRMPLGVPNPKFAGIRGPSFANVGFERTPENL
jgi:hypothetical protein